MKMPLIVLKKINNLLKLLFLTSEQYARYVGVKLGNNCLVGTRDWGSEPYLIIIGDNVQIAKNVHFHTHGGGHVLRLTSPEFDAFGKISIDDWVYIGSESHILPGVSLGKGSLVAAASVVTKSVPAGVVVGGNPARLICTVDQLRERNMKYNIRTNGLTLHEKKMRINSIPEEFFIKKKLLK